MTGQEALNLLVARLGNRRDLTVRASLLAEMQLAQQTLLEKIGTHPWFLRFSDASKSTMLGVGYVAPPDNFLLFDPEWGGLFIRNPSGDTPDRWIPLKRITERDYWLKYVDQEPGIPTHYYESVNDAVGTVVMEFAPVPDADYPLLFKYRGTDAAPADSDTAGNRWLTHAADLLIAWVGYMYASVYVTDSSRATAFEQQFEVALKRVRNFTVARAEPDERNMGEPE